MIFLNRWQALSIGVAILLVGCKAGPQNESEVKTLDNFAAGRTVSINRCEGGTDNSALLARWDRRINLSPALKRTLDPAAQDKYRSQVHSYIKTVPLQVQKAFLDFGGEIVLSAEAKKLCSARMADPQGNQYAAEARRQLEGCYLYTQGDQDTELEDQDLFAVFHQINPADVAEGFDENQKIIAHGGVRIFGLMYAQLFSKIAPNKAADGRKYQFDVYDSLKVSSAKRHLANSFLVDVVKGQDFDLKTLEPLLGANSAADLTRVIKSASAEDLKAIDFLGEYSFGDDGALTKGARELALMRFEDFVFGESFDSYHCSKATLATMIRSFPRSKDAYIQAKEAVAQHIDSLGGFGLTKFDESDTDGFNLLGAANTYRQSNSFQASSGNQSFAQLCQGEGCRYCPAQCNCRNCPNGCANCPYCQNRTSKVASSRPTGLGNAAQNTGPTARPAVSPAQRQATAAFLSRFAALFASSWANQHVA